jgi:hypothetical protein
MSPHNGHIQRVSTGFATTGPEEDELFRFIDNQELKFLTEEQKNRRG